MPSSNVMHEFKHNELHSGSKKGPLVKSRAQAIAIMLSEKRKEGGKYPHRQGGGGVLDDISDEPSPVNYQALGKALQQLPPPASVPRQPVKPSDLFGSRPIDYGKVWGRQMGGPAPPLPPAAHPSSMAPPYMGGVGGLPGMGPPGLGGSPMGMRADGGNVPSDEQEMLDQNAMMESAQVQAKAAMRNRPYMPKPSGEKINPPPYSGSGVGGAYQFGGSPTSMGLTPGWIERQEARGMTHTGPIISGVGGRTDHHAINVPSGSYVLPAAHVSAMGQGNTLNGMQILQGMFGAPMKLTHGAGPPRPPGMYRPPKLTSSGGARGEQIGKPVPIMAAGGEFVLSPEQVAKVGGGDINHGHAVLDRWVQNTHKKYAKTIANLPPPAKT